MSVWKSLRNAIGVGARGLVYLITGTIVVSLVITMVTAGHVWAFARQDDRDQADAILVLGAAQYNGTPSKWFAARLDHAAELYAEGVAPVVVTVGGKQDGDAYTEAQAGSMYLREKGIPDAVIIEINEGSDTLGSAEAFGELAATNGWKSTVVVTDPAHSLRATDMVRGQKVSAHASPTRTGPAVSGREAQFKSILHETGGLLYYRVTRQGGSDYTVKD